MAKFELETARQRIDFRGAVPNQGTSLPELRRGRARIHDRLRRAWQQLDSFQFEAWLHADVPRVCCASCGKTSQAGVAKAHRAAVRGHADRACLAGGFQAAANR